jgi:hypothetical protein
LLSDRAGSLIEGPRWEVDDVEEGRLILDDEEVTSSIGDLVHARGARCISVSVSSPSITCNHLARGDGVSEVDQYGPLGKVSSKCREIAE